MYQLIHFQMDIKTPLLTTNLGSRPKTGIKCYVSTNPVDSAFYFYNNFKMWRAQILKALL